jgi:hypothetical protein
MTYKEFLENKRITSCATGFESTRRNPKLFEWQSDIVRWALRKGKCAIFADCGLGKTPMQLEWAQQVAEHENKPVLILAPLAVGKQTQREGVKFGIDVTICRDQADVRMGVNVANYEMLSHFEPSAFCGIVLDESSILKHQDSKTRQMLTDAFCDIRYKLCCTATPAPNDFMELGNHAEFLGVMTHTEMLATFFVHDGGDTAKWRLKGHAESKFFEWVAEWACCLTSPQDLGYEQKGYDLPELRIYEIQTKSENLCDATGQMRLVADTKQTLNERREARRDSLRDRVQAAAEIANATTEQVLVWCDLNAESEALTGVINGAVEVKGADTIPYKESAMMGFTTGDNRVLVSKPKIAGFGMNWQNCHKIIFVGLSDSFEAYYQAVRRCWRFGQKEPVDVYVVISDAEGCVKNNIERKQADAERMTAELAGFTREILTAEIHSTVRMSENYYAIERMEVPEWLQSVA